jgi:hypothetical protein
MNKAIFKSLTKLCAYTHLFKVISALVNGEDISELTKGGRNIALLGIFCPFFWFALFSGADEAEVMFHGTHSSIVFFIGIAIMTLGIRKTKSSDGR